MAGTDDRNEGGTLRPAPELEAIVQGLSLIRVSCCLSIHESGAAR